MPLEHDPLFTGTHQRMPIPLICIVVKRMPVDHTEVAQVLIECTKKLSFPQTNQLRQISLSMVTNSYSFDKLSIHAAYLNKVGLYKLALLQIPHKKLGRNTTQILSL